MYNCSRVIFHMKNNNLLITTAMLTTVFEKNKMDTFDLMCPFILEIIFDCKNCDEANLEYIQRQLDLKYSFYNFPMAILKIITNRLKKQNKIIQVSNKFEISDKKIENEIKEFETRLEKSKEESDYLITELVKFLISKGIKNVDKNKAEQYFSLFLKRNGYSIFANEDKEIKFDLKKDQINYLIGMFITENHEKDTKIFKDLKRIVEGFMLATALYVQVESDNKVSFNKLACYLDAPFILRILGYKTKYMNDSSLELKKLLENLGAKIKCFEHNYSEVEGILENYIRNHGKRLEKTLEGLDVSQYSTTELQIMLDNLGERFKELNIEIVSTPEYKQDEYCNVIDEKKLLEMLKDNYKEEVSNSTLERDVASASAIIRLRKNKKYRKIEDSKAIFITTNYSVRNCVKSLLSVDDSFEISPIISDIDMTAITWLKSLNSKFNQNSDLLTIKLIENARASMEPTQNIIKEFNNCIKRMSSDSKIPIDANSLSNLLTSIYFRKQLMEDINGLDENVTEKQILETYEKTNLLSEQMKSENEILIEKNKVLNSKLIEEVKLRNSSAKTIKENLNSRINKNTEIILKTMKHLTIVIVLVMLLILGTFLYFEDFAKVDKSVKNILLSLYSVISFALTFYPVKAHVYKFYDKKKIYIYDALKRYEEKKIKKYGIDL